MRKVNKIWATKYARWPSVAKYLISVKKIIYAVFFGVPKNLSVTAIFYKETVLKESGTNATMRNVNDLELRV